VKQAQRQEEEQRRALSTLRRKLQRAEHEETRQTHRIRKAAEGQLVRDDMDRRVGRDLTDQVKSVAPATSEEVAALAAQLHEGLAGRPWFFLWRQMDGDSSGRISYAELKRGVRGALGLDKDSLPDARLQALWRAIDADASGSLSVGEFGHLLRRGERASARARQPKEREKEPVLNEARVKAKEKEAESVALEVQRATEARERMAREMAELDRLLKEKEARLEVIREAAPPELTRPTTRATVVDSASRSRTTVHAGHAGASLSSRGPRKAPSDDVLRAYGVRRRISTE